MGWFHDIFIAVIASGLPVALLARPVWRTHRQTKTSNGTTLAHLVEQHGRIIKTMEENQHTMSKDIASVARYVGQLERRRRLP